SSEGGPCRGWRSPHAGRACPHPRSPYPHSGSFRRHRPVLSPARLQVQFPVRFSWSCPLVDVFVCLVLFCLWGPFVVHAAPHSVSSSRQFTSISAMAAVFGRASARAVISAKSSGWIISSREILVTPSVRSVATKL